MPDKELSETMATFIGGIANNNPAPILCKVKKNYTGDDNHVDVTTELGDLKHVPCICGNTVGALGVLIFINGDNDSPFAIIDR